MKVRDVMNWLELLAPPAYQEAYDNAGLLFGDPDGDIRSVLVSLDLTPAVIREAVNKQCGMVVSHHPFLFGPVRSITAGTPHYEILQEAFRNHISLYAIHTNLDNSFDGLNRFWCSRLGITRYRVLSPRKKLLSKLVTFCPLEYADKVRQALFDAGAGQIGNYDQCSYNVEGFGTFRASSEATPFVGEKNALHREPEVRIEVVFPRFLETRLMEALRKAHPYEEVACDLYPLLNHHDRVGSGITGVLDHPVTGSQFLEKVREALGLPHLRYSGDVGKTIRSVSLCTGSGSFLISEAEKAGSDIYLTGDLKYHDFQKPAQMLLADIGHFESEQIVRELISDYLIQKIPNFAVLISETEENPVKYL